MNWITARRRHPKAGYAVVILALALVGLVYATIAGHSSAADAALQGANEQDVKAGEQLFNTTCATCHGFKGIGGQNAPSLVGVGAAAVDFQVSTGRMPAATYQGAQIPQKTPTFNAEQTRQIVAYVASLGGGPAIPGAEQVDPTGADPALGGRLFMDNCSQCHNFAGEGGALTGGKYAPPLTNATPTQIYEAMLTGPQSMPVFNDTTITPEQKRAIIAYITQTRAEPNPGGFSLGRLGPVTEGIAGWLVGIGLLVLAAMWITAKQREE